VTAAAAARDDEHSRDGGLTDRSRPCTVVCVPLQNIRRRKYNTHIGNNRRRLTIMYVCVYLFVPAKRYNM